MKKMLALICFTLLNLAAQEVPTDAPKQEAPKREGTGSGELEKRPLQGSNQGTKEVSRISTRGTAVAASVTPYAMTRTTSRTASVSRVNLRRPTATSKATVAPAGGSSNAL